MDQIDDEKNAYYEKVFTDNVSLFTRIANVKSIYSRDSLERDFKKKRKLIKQLKKEGYKDYEILEKAYEIMHGEKRPEHLPLSPLRKEGKKLISSSKKITNEYTNQEREETSKDAELSSSNNMKEKDTSYLIHNLQNAIIKDAMHNSNYPETKNNLKTSENIGRVSIKEMDNDKSNQEKNIRNEGDNDANIVINRRKSESLFVLIDHLSIDNKMLRVELKKVKEDMEKITANYSSMCDRVFNLETELFNFHKTLDDLVSNSTKNNSKGQNTKMAWTKHKDEKTGVFFYYNESLDISQWDCPTDFIETNSNPLAPLEPPCNTKRGDWEKHLDSATNAYFYFNKVTNASQWENPFDEDEKREDKLNLTNKNENELYNKKEEPYNEKEEIENTKEEINNTKTNSFIEKNTVLEEKQVNIDDVRKEYFKELTTRQKSRKNLLDLISQGEVKGGMKRSSIVMAAKYNRSVNSLISGTNTETENNTFEETTSIEAVDHWATLARDNLRNSYIEFLDESLIEKRYVLMESIQKEALSRIGKRASVSPVVTISPLSSLKESIDSPTKKDVAKKIISHSNTKQRFDSAVYFAGGENSDKNLLNLGDNNVNKNNNNISSNNNKDEILIKKTKQAEIGRKELLKRKLL